MDTLEQFVRDFLAGKVEEYVKSEPVPESNDEPVKVLLFCVKCMLNNFILHVHFIFL